MDTYEQIYNRMKQNYIQSSGAGFDDTSDIAIRLKVLAGELYDAQTNYEWLKRQMFVTTAEGVYLDYFASQRGLERKQAQKANGEITFSITEPKSHDVVIPKGSVVATVDNVPLRFYTTEDDCITSGNTLVSVYATAEKAGACGNIKAGCPVVAVSVPSEVDSVAVRDMFSGGNDAENDEQLRKRIKNAFVFPSNGTNAAYYEQLALSVDGIAKAGIVAKARGSGTVNVYVCGQGTELDTDTIQLVQNIMNENRELNVDVLALQAQYKYVNLDISVTAKSGCSEETVKSKCTKAFSDCLDAIPIGGKFFLSNLGSFLFNTGCIENYEFNTSMTDDEATGSQCFATGLINIEVK